MSAFPLVSEAEILSLVAERESFRHQRRFDESDAIREELRSKGVEVYDKEREWRSNDGRSGVLFTAGPKVCSLAERSITSLVVQREEARTAKDFAVADKIRDELRGEGVELDDKARTWRTVDGRSAPYGSQDFQHLPPAQDLYTNSPSDAEIRSLVVERERARAVQDYATADCLRQHLLSVGVELNDSERVWRASDGRQGTIVTGGSDTRRCPLGDAEIQSLVAQREEARGQKDFLRGDRIREELRRSGCELIDNEKRWQTVDGRQGHYSGAVLRSTRVARSSLPAVQEPSKRPRTGVKVEEVRAHTPPHPTVRATGSGTLSLSLPSIQALVAGRELARGNRDFNNSDAIREDLRGLGIEVWDKKKEWKSSDGRQGPILPFSAIS